MPWFSILLQYWHHISTSPWCHTTDNEIRKHNLLDVADCRKIFRCLFEGFDHHLMDELMNFSLRLGFYLKNHFIDISVCYRHRCWINTCRSWWKDWRPKSSGPTTPQSRCNSNLRNLQIVRCHFCSIVFFKCNSVHWYFWHIVQTIGSSYSKI